VPDGRFAVGRQDAHAGELLDEGEESGEDVLEGEEGAERLGRIAEERFDLPAAPVCRVPRAEFAVVEAVCLGEALEVGSSALAFSMATAPTRSNRA